MENSWFRFLMSRTGYWKYGLLTDNQWCHIPSFVKLPYSFFWLLLLFLKQTLWHVNQNTTKGPLIYYVKVFWGFLELLIPLRKALFTTQSKEKLPFSEPPRPLCPNVIYRWSPIRMIPNSDFLKNSDSKEFLLVNAY